jgi:hypothetical protein
MCDIDGLGETDQMGCRHFLYGRIAFEAFPQPICQCDRGAIAFTRMVGAKSTAIARVREAMPPLAVV